MPTPVLWLLMKTTMIRRLGRHYRLLVKML
jgi:hypothetical protein